MMSFAIPLSERAKALLAYPVEEGASAGAEVASAHIRLAVEAALDRGETHYTDRPGILLLREKIAGLLRDRFGVEMSAKNDVIVTCGVTEARFLAIEQLLQPGDVLGAPGSGKLLFGAALLRGAELASAIPANARMVCLKSSSGEGLLRSQLALTPASALILFEVDKSENGFHPGQLEGLQNRTITIGGLGEESWRIGYLASPGGPSGILRDFKQALTICSTNLSQWALLAALEAL
jgi:aspartate/methionine/tyrosine aminotransferase